MRRNITLALDDDLIRKARVLAAHRNCSVSGLLREELSRLVAENEAYEAARQAALKRLALAIVTQYLTWRVVESTGGFLLAMAGRRSN